MPEVDGLAIEDPPSPATEIERVYFELMYEPRRSHGWWWWEFQEQDVFNPRVYHDYIWRGFDEWGFQEIRTRASWELPISEEAMEGLP
eukprot:414373-Amphidinium_carterae.2